MILLCLAAFGLVGASVGLSAVNAANELHVSPDPSKVSANPSYYGSIQEAVSQSKSGDTIIIHGGEYSETVKIGTCSSCADSTEYPGERQITIKAVNDNGPTVLTGSPAIRIADNNGAEVELSGVAFAQTSTAVSVRGDSEVSISNNAFLQGVGTEMEAEPGIGNGLTYPDVTSEGPNYVSGSPDYNIRGNDERSPVSVFGDVDVSAETVKPFVNNRKGTIYVSSDTGSEEYGTPYSDLETAVRHAAYGTTIEVIGDNNYGSVVIEDPPVGDVGPALRITGTSGTPKFDTISVQSSSEVVLEQLEVNQVSYSGSTGYIKASKLWWGQSSGPTEDQYSSSTIINPYCVGPSCYSLSKYDTKGETCLVVGSEDTCEAGGNQVVVNYGTLERSAQNPRIFTIPVSVQNNAGVTANVDVRLAPSSDSVTKFGPIQPGETSEEKTAVVAIEDSDIEELQLSLVAETAFNQRHVVAVPVGSSQTLTSRELEFPGTLNTQASDTGSTVQDSGSRAALAVPVNTTPARFIDGDTQVEALEDEVVPPRNPSGDVEKFANLRAEEGKPVEVTPSAGDSGTLEVGASVYSIPSATNHSFILTYQLQAERGEYVNLHLVDENGDIIDAAADERDDRVLSDTVSSDYDGSVTGINTDDAAPFETRRQVVNLSDKEVQYVNETGRLYVTIERESTEDVFSLLLSNTYVMSFDETREDDLDSDDNVPDSTTDEDIQNPQEGDGYELTYVVPASFNSEYGTYDVSPGQAFNVIVTLENTEDVVIEREVSLAESYTNPELVEDRAFAGLGQSVQPQIGSVLQSATLRAGPGETDRAVFEMTWQKHEFGTHNLGVYDTTTNNPKPVAPENQLASTLDVYVYQPATAEIVDVETPDYALFYDNWNMTVTVRNRGDLSGEVKIETDVGTLTDNGRAVSLAAGDARGGRTGPTTTLTWTRGSGLGADYTPPKEGLDFAKTANFPGESSNRPRSPFSSDDTAPEGTVSEKELEDDNITANHTWALPQNTGEGTQPLWDALKSNNSTNATLYKLEISGFRVTDPSSDETWMLRQDPGSSFFASPYPYVIDGGVPGEGFNASEFGTDSYLNKRCDNSTHIPLTHDRVDSGACEPGGAFQVWPPLEQIERDESGLTYGDSGLPAEDTQAFVARVRVGNPYDYRHGTARIKIVANESRSDEGYPIGVSGTPDAEFEELPNRTTHSANVVGAADADIGPKETKWVKVPIVIRNNIGNEGTYNLTVKPRHPDDYIRLVQPDTEVPDSNVSKGSYGPYTAAVNITTYGDLVFREIGPSPNKIDKGFSEDNETVDFNTSEKCTGTGQKNIEGYNPAVPNDAVTDNAGTYQEECLQEESQRPERLFLSAEYKNYGTEDVTITFRQRYKFLNNKSVGKTKFRNKSINENRTIQDWMNAEWDTTRYAEFENERSQTVSPGESTRFNTSQIWREPGLYNNSVKPVRATNNDTLNQTFNGTEWSGPVIPDRRYTVRVFDLMEPIAAFGEDSKLPTKAQVGPETDGAYKEPNEQGTSENTPLEVYEGGRLLFNGSKSVDNVGTTNYNWTVDGEEPSYRVDELWCNREVNRENFREASKKNRIGGHWCYSKVEANATVVNPPLMYHRFKEPEQKTVTLNVSDYERLVNKTEPHYNETSVTVTVKEDTHDPVADLSRANDGVVWHREPNTDLVYNGDSPENGRILVRLEAQQSDTEVGIESDSWRGDLGSNNETDFSPGADDVYPSDSRELTFKSEGEYNFYYKVWDFVGKTDSADEDVVVKHDSTDPETVVNVQDWVWAGYDTATFDATDSFDRGQSGGVGVDDDYIDWIGAPFNQYDGEFKFQHTFDENTYTADRTEETLTSLIRDYHENEDKNFKSIEVYNDNDNPEPKLDVSTQLSGTPGAYVGVEKVYGDASDSYDKGPDPDGDGKDGIGIESYDWYRAFSGNSGEQVADYIGGRKSGGGEYEVRVNVCDTYYNNCAGQSYYVDGLRDNEKPELQTDSVTVKEGKSQSVSWTVKDSGNHGAGGTGVRYMRTKGPSNTDQTKKPDRLSTSVSDSTGVRERVSTSEGEYYDTSQQFEVTVWDWHNNGITQSFTLRVHDDQDDDGVYDANDQCETEPEGENGQNGCPESDGGDGGDDGGDDDGGSGGGGGGGNPIQD